MVKFLEKMILSDKDYEYLTKGIAIGVGTGVLVGAIIGNITLTFAAGGVIGILSAFIYSIYKRNRISDWILKYIHKFYDKKRSFKYTVT